MKPLTIVLLRTAETVGKIKQSTDYFERGLKMQNVRTPSDTAEEQNQLARQISILETTKRMFTFLQRLILWAVAIKDMIGEDVAVQEILSYKPDPATGLFLQTERGDLTRKALLWAERGRSRSLVQQLLANKPLDKPIHSMVNFNMTDDQVLTKQFPKLSLILWSSQNNLPRLHISPAVFASSSYQSLLDNT